MWGDFATRHRGWEQVVCCSLGYFLFDLIHISILKPTPSDYYESVFHHLLTLYVHFIPVCVYHGYVQLSMVGCKLIECQAVPSGASEQAPAAVDAVLSESCCTRADLAELSTPFVNIRWFMLKASLTDHPYYLVNGGLMAVVFFACRIVNGLWLLYVTVYQAWFAPYSNSARTFSEYMGAVGYALGPLITLFYLLWSYWFILIVQGIKAAVLGSDFKNDPDQEGGSLVGRAIESVASPKSSKKE